MATLEEIGHRKHHLAHLLILICKFQTSKQTFEPGIRVYSIAFIYQTIWLIFYIYLFNALYFFTNQTVLEFDTQAISFSLKFVQTLILLELRGLILDLCLLKEQSKIVEVYRL